MHKAPVMGHGGDKAGRAASEQRLDRAQYQYVFPVRSQMQAGGRRQSQLTSKMWEKCMSCHRARKVAKPRD